MFVFESRSRCHYWIVRPWFTRSATRASPPSAVRTKLSPDSTLLTDWFMALMLILAELISRSRQVWAVCPVFFRPEEIRSMEFCNPDRFRLIVLSNWLKVTPLTGSTILISRGLCISTNKKSHLTVLSMWAKRKTAGCNAFLSRLELA